MEGERDQDVSRERPAIRADAEHPHDHRQHEVHDVEVEDEWHATIVREPDAAKLAEQRHLCDAHDGDQTAQHKAEQDGNGDHFHRKRQRRREPWEEPKEVGEIECKHSSGPCDI